MELNDRVYQASMQKLYFTEMGEGSQILTTLDKENTLIALLLFDETELVKARRENSDQQMVTALLYIDNYDEAFDSVEEVKRSFVTA